MTDPLRDIEQNARVPHDDAHDEGEPLQIAESEWQFDDAAKEWRLVETGRHNVERGCWSFGVESGNLGFAAVGGVVAGLGWIFRRLIRRRRGGAV